MFTVKFRWNGRIGVRMVIADDIPDLPQRSTPRRKASSAVITKRWYCSSDSCALTMGENRRHAAIALRR